MKTTKLLLIMMAVTSLMACKQEQTTILDDTSMDTPDSKIHMVTLNVRTDIILADSAKIAEDPGLDEYAYFEKDQKTSNEEHTIHVKKGDIIIWRGIPEKDSKDAVNITAISFQEGEGLTNIFKQETIPGNGEVPGLVVATVLKGPDSIGDSKDNNKPLIYKYKLNIEVLSNSMAQNKMYQIDPKIQVH